MRYYKERIGNVEYLNENDKIWYDKIWYDKIKRENDKKKKKNAV